MISDEGNDVSDVGNNKSVADNMEDFASLCDINIHAKPRAGIPASCSAGRYEPGESNNGAKEGNLLHPSLRSLGHGEGIIVPSST